MNIKYMMAAFVALVTCACDTESTDEFRSSYRVPVVEFDCDNSGCLGRWDATDAWSPVYSWRAVASFQPVDPSTIWQCDASPDVDACVLLDQQGHIGCFRNEAGWGVAAAPSCAVTGVDWIDVGNDMVAKVTSYYDTSCTPGTLGCPCSNGSCNTGLTCAVAENESNVCSMPAANSPCDHGIDLEYDGVEYDGACVASCTQFIDNCGPMECSPKDAFAQGLCAWPI